MFGGLTTAASAEPSAKTATAARTATAAARSTGRARKFGGSKYPGLTDAQVQADETGADTRVACNKRGCAGCRDQRCGVIHQRRIDIGIAGDTVVEGVYTRENSRPGSRLRIPL